jgi:DNA repair protein SbcD/Mre11
MKKEAKEHVIILDKKEPVFLSDYDLDAVVYPGPCHAKHSSENAVGWVREIPKDEKYTHIGIAHGSLEGVSPDFDQRYYPMTMNELKNSGVDIWLIGHTHITYPDKPGSRDIIFNPGTPEPDGFDCRHEGRAFLHTIDAQKKITTDVISTGSCRFIKK